MLLLYGKVALLVYVLVSPWLNTAYLLLFPQEMVGLLLGMISLGLLSESLDQFVIVLGALVFVLEDGLLLEDAPHHFHADGSLLLVVVSWPWI